MFHKKNDIFNAASMNIWTCFTTEYHISLIFSLVQICIVVSWRFLLQMALIFIQILLLHLIMPPSIKHHHWHDRFFLNSWTIIWGWGCFLLQQNHAGYVSVARQEIATRFLGFRCFWKICTNQVDRVINPIPVGLLWYRVKTMPKIKGKWQAVINLIPTQLE